MEWLLLSLAMAAGIVVLLHGRGDLMARPICDCHDTRRDLLHVTAIAAYYGIKFWHNICIMLRLTWNAALWCGSLFGVGILGIAMP